MTSPRTTRRHAVIAIVAVCLLVLGGLGWATHSAISLERLEAQAASERSLDEARALALSKLDALIAPVLGRELAWPYEYFRPSYKPVVAFNEKDWSVVDESILLPSPLRELRGPDWLLLHFQATETDESEKWSSPQIEEGGLQSATPAWVIPATDWDRQASAERWLAALRERYTPLDLLQELENALGARIEQPRPPPRVSIDESDGDESPGIHGGDAKTPGRVSRSAAEFVRRGARLVQLQNESRPGAKCLPETVAFENLESGTPIVRPGRGSLDCVEVSATTMKPVWLDITMDGWSHLAFIRSVTVETSDYCTLQGVLIDWDLLRKELEGEVRNLFPSARIVPVPADASVQPNMTHTMMQTIPARLDPGELGAAQTTTMSTGLKVGLSVAWVATIFALVAIGYGTMKYVTLMERRMRFMSAVTHELRTPLTSFQLYADLLADMPEEDTEQRRHHVETLRGEAERLARLVENVLAYSRIGDSKPALQWRKVSPQRLLDATGAAIKEHSSASGKQLVIKNRCADNPAIETDAEFVVQIMTNLLENACKYSANADDPRIWLTATRTADDHVTFEVDDAGPGVLPYDRRDIFQPFRRGSPAGAGHAGGMGLGLGLALSGYWASCLGGRLTLRRSPRNNARYTSFVLSLPITRTS